MENTSPGIISFDCDINAISSHPDKLSFVCVGRNVFKIIQWTGDTGWKEIHNLRTGKGSLNLSSVDVQWNQHNEHIIASAATNSSVVLWNLDRPKKQGSVLKEHTRTVNRISWQPQTDHCLLSASSDGTLKLWDLAVCKSTITFDCRKSAHDVQFNIHNPYQFAVGLESGIIQLWDIRNSSRVESQFTGAHSNYVFALQWHPENKNWIASGGRDHFIKVWDIQQQNGPPVCSIPTISSVGSLHWRPSRYYQIVSAASSMDALINIWDIRRPYIPIGVISSHTDVCSGFSWMQDTRYLISCGRDSRVIRNDLNNDAFLPYKNISSTSISWSPADEIAAVHEDVNRTLCPSMPERHLAIKIPPEPRNMETKLSQKTRYVEITSVASEVYQKQIQIPKISAPANPSALMWFPPNFEPELDDFSHPGGNSGKYPNFGLSSQTLIYLAQNYKFLGNSFADKCDHNTEIANSVKLYKVAQLWQILKMMFGEDTTHKPKSCDGCLFSTPYPIPTSMDTPPLKDEIDLQGLAHSDIPDDVISVMKPLPKEDLDYYDQFGNEAELKPSLLPGNSSSELPPVIPPDTLSVNSSTEQIKPPAELIPPIKPKERAIPSLSKVQTSFVDWKIPKEIVLAALTHHALQGDVITPSTVYLALSDVDIIPENNALIWIENYLNFLYRLQLPVIAANIIKSCRLEKIKKKSFSSTEILSSCTNCNKPTTPKGWYCKNCNQLKVCAICQQVVKGRYVWCQGCGHGGHIEHMENWFKVNFKCPIGCSHICRYVPIQQESKTEEITRDEGN